MASKDQARFERMERKLHREKAARKEAERLAEERTADLYLANRALSEESQKALAAAEAKSQFLATMSHEIRTPLNAIIGMSELLQEAELNTEQKEWISIVNISSQSLLSLINDILDFSKIESGRLELEDTSFDLRLCMEETLEMLSIRASENDLELICNYPDEFPRFFIGDPTRIRQVLLNLVGNAVKFTGEGEIKLECTEVVKTEDEQVRIRLNVADTGIGIPKDKQAAIFDSFSQADSSTTRQFGGTGLGLTISRCLCELMGGTMGVTSSGIKGEGSEFYFDMLLQEADVEEQLPDLSRLKGLQALVVDDNKNNLMILKHHLEHWGVKVLEFDHPENAVAALASKPAIDLAILDMQMPDIDGVQLAEKLSKTHSSCPILLLTSMGKVETPENSKLFHAQHTKPVRTDILLAELLSMTRSYSGHLRNKPVSEIDAALSASIPLNILLVDDNVMNRKVGTKLLERLGYAPDLAEDGEKALTALKAKQYDLVLMDVQMPVMDGITASKIIYEQWPEEQRPHVFALTADIQASTRKALIDAGVEQVLSKPIQLHDLAESLQKLSSKAR
ncbi:hypothetical protein EOPP23_11130 [Endozoicomonas sp. OPT23]|uniref:response regulator n=1 Tax=Endozoicomonas sp. OPT23 TaxID=2072845 RepID=UPI00129A4E45|nr:response regulator [Endozoicomonas sp. OPT23]MRI33538.1 hypothetical protein [Endozoicomonas sp. OPT23]